MSSNATSNRVIITAAIIGMLGTVTAALIRSWDWTSTDPNDARVEVDLSGTWYIQATTKETTYNPFKDLAVRYKILVTLNENGIIANGNKIGEVSNGKATEYSGEAKTPIRLTGTIGKDELGHTMVKLNGYDHNLEGRLYATAFQLRLLNRSQMVGTFSSIIADSKGKAAWIREDEWLIDGWGNL